MFWSFDDSNFFIYLLYQNHQIGIFIFTNNRFTMSKKGIIIFFFAFIGCQITYSQAVEKDRDSLSGFDSFNKKMEGFFKVFPVPIISQTQEAGTIIGLAKFNVFDLSKKDTISKPSKISESVTFSSKGRININVSNDLIFHENDYMILTNINYKKQPEYLLGIGNDVSIDDIEEVTTEKVRVVNSSLRRIRGDLYAGIGIELADYFNVEADSTSFLVEDMVTGLEGGTDFGLGFVLLLDSRDNRYNASDGWLLKSTFMFYEESLGSRYGFKRFELDTRKYFNPWYEHVIAVQATTTSVSGNVPYYDLALLGGPNKMRGYYEGALRDKILVDTQVEYRIPIWNIFGAVAFVGTGRVAESYSDLDLDGFWISYGAGLRIKVDSENNVNLRLDYGFNQNGSGAFIFSFAEAF